MQAVAATGTPVVLVLVAGRPIGSPAVHAAAAAVLHGLAAGRARARTAIADALTGAVNPGGKLPDQLPAQLGADPGLLRPQGVGRALALEGRVRRHVEPAAVPVRIRPVVLDVRRSSRCRSATRSSPSATRSPCRRRSRNTGDVAATRSCSSTAAIRWRRSRGRCSSSRRSPRVTLDPGEQATVDFELAVADLGFHDRSGTYVVEAGEIDVFVGTSATDLDAGRDGDRQGRSGRRSPSARSPTCAHVRTAP